MDGAEVGLGSGQLDTRGFGAHSRTLQKVVLRPNYLFLIILRTLTTHFPPLQPRVHLLLNLRFFAFIVFFAGARRPPDHPISLVC